MLNVKELNKKDKELLFAIKDIANMPQSCDHDATPEYIEYFKNSILNTCELMEQFNHKAYLFLGIEDVRRLLNMYVDSKDFENRLLLSNIIINNYIVEYYKSLYDYLADKVLKKVLTTDK